MPETDKEYLDPQDLSDPDGEIELCHCGQVFNDEGVCLYCQEEEKANADDEA